MSGSYSQYVRLVPPSNFAKLIFSHLLPSSDRELLTEVRALRELLVSQAASLMTQLEDLEHS